MNLVETFIIVTLKSFSHLGVSLYSLQVPSAFGGRVEFGVNRTQIFPQGVLAAITLLRGGAGDVGVRQEPIIKWSFPSAKWPSLPY